MGALLSGVAALFFVLGLLVLSARWLRALSVGRSAGERDVRLDVVARVGLGPKQGVAAVRFEDELALVSYGEGGVRLITSRSAADSGTAETGTTLTFGRELGNVATVQLPVADGFPPDSEGGEGTAGELPDEGGGWRRWHRVRQVLRLGLIGGLALAALLPAPVEVWAAQDVAGAVQEATQSLAERVAS